MLDIYKVGRTLNSSFFSIQAFVKHKMHNKPICSKYTTKNNGLRLKWNDDDELV